MSYLVPPRSVFTNFKSIAPFWMFIGLIYQVTACFYILFLQLCSATQRDPMAAPTIINNCITLGGQSQVDATKRSLVLYSIVHTVLFMIYITSI